MNPTIKVQNVSSQHVFRPANGIKGQVFDGILIKGEVMIDDLKGTFSFKYPYITTKYPDLAKKVADAVLRNQTHDLPEGVSELRVKGF